MKKAFLIVFWIFLTLINFVSVPELITHRDYVNLFITIIISLIMTLISIWLYRVVVIPADNFSISREDEVVLSKKNKIIKINISEIKKIIVTPYRYIFLADRKYSVSRIVKAFKIEHSVNTHIYDLASKANIKIEHKLLWL